MVTIIKLTVLFDDPFWIGVFESIENGEYKVCKVTFGSEPKDEEVYELILKKFYRLNFSLPVSSDDFKLPAKKPNPKRLQRSIRKEVNVKGIGTKAQIAIQLQHEQSKIVRKQKSKEQKEQEEQRKFELRKKKKLEKHKGH
ncbi:YjdF family protein [Clostridium beijerinckii]|uniref:YjdF family protein n=1 Tax=Clostridium beijerinckii TaxID=1520 RepID=A0A7X9SL93_CLOBE|nr:YjdF family protein [Clostridium beijerinckii]NMF03984.1 YjdF family protein [Clostridium beijerinckii]